MARRSGGGSGVGHLRAPVSDRGGVIEKTRQIVRQVGVVNNRLNACVVGVALIVAVPLVSEGAFISREGLKGAD